jgi:type IV fimbrial biogenesis protein FimT
MRTGTSVLEVLIVVALITLLAGFAAPSLAALHERAAVHGATTELVSVLATARHLAVARHARTAVRLDDTRGTAIVVSHSDTVHRRDLRASHGVALEVSRDSIAYGPTGRGYGAANTRIIIRRGRAADTITVSRLGRVRRG